MLTLEASIVSFHRGALDLLWVELNVGFPLVETAVAGDEFGFSNKVDLAVRAVDQVRRGSC